MKLDIAVRDVVGAIYTFSAQPDTTLRNFRRQVQDRLGGKAKLMFRVSLHVWAFRSTYHHLMLLKAHTSPPWRRKGRDPI